MKRLNPYICFSGRTREALSFYQSIFGGDISFMTVAETPEEIRAMCPPNSDDQVMHGQLELGAFALMGSDLGSYDFSSGEHKETQMSIAVDCQDKAQIEKFYHALGEGGSFGCPLGPAFWGGDFGMVTDKYGVSWMLTLMG